MQGIMRCVTWSCLLALLAWLAAPSVHAEGVEERATVPSSAIRLRGAAGIGAIPGGYISVGGSRLQLLEGSSKRWRTLHQVQGDNLYRVKADDDGRLLASWEQERVFHLFDRARGTHLAIPKPPAPPGYPPDTFHIEALYFDDDGRDAIVFIDGDPYLGAAIGQREVVAAYRVALDGKTAPRLLFAEEGVELQFSPRGAILIKPRSWQHELLAGRLQHRGDHRAGAGRRARHAPHAPRGRRPSCQRRPPREGTRRRALRRPGHGSRRRQEHAGPVALPLRRPSRVPAAVGEPHVGLPALAPHPVGRVRRGAAGGRPEPDDDADDGGRRGDADDDSSVDRRAWPHGRRAGSRASASARMAACGCTGPITWCSCGETSAPRKVDISHVLGRGTEWAGAYVYVARPEGLWVGIEMGGGRDYRFLEMADLEKRAVPWTPPAPGSDAPPPLPLVATKLSGQRRALVLGGVTVSVGDTEMYSRSSGKEAWQLLYGVPGRSIYRMATDEAARADPRVMVRREGVSPVPARDGHPRAVPLAGVGHEGSQRRPAGPVLLDRRPACAGLHERPRHGPVAGHQRGIPRAARPQRPAAPPVPRRGAAVACLAARRHIREVEPEPRLLGPAVRRRRHRRRRHRRQQRHRARHPSSRSCTPTTWASCAAAAPTGSRSSPGTGLPRGRTRRSPSCAFGTETLRWTTACCLPAARATPSGRSSPARASTWSSWRSRRVGCRYAIIGGTARPPAGTCRRFLSRTATAPPTAPCTAWGSGRAEASGCTGATTSCSSATGRPAPTAS